MVKQIAPSKITGGGGFNFEDKVVAYFITCLLSGKPPMDPDLGIITRIDFQTRSLGWYLDDILLSLESAGRIRYCAFSIKSNRQFSGVSAPKDFVLSVWEQFLQEKLPDEEAIQVFIKNRDYLGLVLAPISPDLAKDLHLLLEMARKQDPKDIPNRISKENYTSDSVRRIFSSFDCPDQLAKTHDITERNTGELLRHIRYIQFDFEAEPSDRLREAIQNCRSILCDESLEESQRLWEKLLIISKEYRRNLDISILLDS